MQDFASTAMIRVIHAGMSRLGLPPVAQPPTKQAHVALQDKRALMGHVLRTGGWPAVLQLGQGVNAIEDEPLINLLVQPGQPWRVLDAWLRLERYLHSRHRIGQTRLSECAVQHQHAGRYAGAKPMAVESWLVLGVLGALLERSGCQCVDASLQDASPLLRAGRVVATAQQLHDWSQTDGAHTWHLQWRIAQQHLPVTAWINTAPTSLKAEMKRWIHDTGNWQPDINNVATALNLSRRSLQRRLGEQGTRFVDVVGQVRIERASQMLVRSTNQLAEIGFAAGYSDQAHFCRDFKRRTGLSPKSFRETSLSTSQSAADPSEQSD